VVDGESDLLLSTPVLPEVRKEEVRFLSARTNSCRLESTYAPIGQGEIPALSEEGAGINPFPLRGGKGKDRTQPYLPPASWGQDREGIDPTLPTFGRGAPNPSQGGEGSILLHPRMGQEPSLPSIGKSLVEGFSLSDWQPT